ncbi:hypothetical protein [Paenibacillus kribbensis]|nr:hypothetical protein [Paenibacillus kribbensis]
MKVTYRATAQTDGASHRHRPRISEIKPMNKVEIRGSDASEASFPTESF